jgi:hypothetical protein
VWKEEEKGKMREMEKIFFVRFALIVILEW